MDKDTEKLLKDVSKITNYEYVAYDDDTTEEKLFCALRDLLEAYDNLYDEKDDLHRELMDYQQYSHNYNW